MNNTDNNNYNDLATSIRQDSMLTKWQISLLVDSYSQQIKYNKRYILLDLCSIIILYFYNYFHFFILFENQKPDEKNKLLCFNTGNKQKRAMENVGNILEEHHMVLNIIMKIINKI